MKLADITLDGIKHIDGETQLSQKKSNKMKRLQIIL